MGFEAEFPSRFVPYESNGAIEIAIRRLGQDSIASLKGAQDKLALAANRFLELLAADRLDELRRSERRRLPWALGHARPPLIERPELGALLRLFEHDCPPLQLLGFINSLLRAEAIPSANLGQLVVLIRRYLDAYQGPLEDLRHWREVAPLVFAMDAPARVGEWVLTQKQKMSVSLRELRLPFGEIHRRTVRGLITAVGRSPAFPRQVPELLEMVQPMGDDLLKFALNEVLKGFARNPTLSADQDLLDLAVRKLGDPRLTRNTRWGDMDPEAKQRVITWLSKEDLELYFRAVAMDEDRRAFWLTYIDQMTYTRLVLSRDVMRASDPVLQRFLKQGRHAELEGYSSAFIFVIGHMLFVEFGETGDACYFYDRESHPVDLDLRIYTRHDLKDMIYLPDGTTNRIVHRGDWMPRARQRLREFGITMTKRTR